MAAAFEGARPNALSDRRAVKAIIASTVGFSLDMFDLFILLYVVPAVGKVFFPSESPTLSVAAVYASFAVTLVMRPVGSALFGNYADRHGRKGAMIIAVIGVGLVTAAFGVLPTLAQIGVAASVMFLILRSGRTFERDDRAQADLHHNRVINIVLLPACYLLLARTNDIGMITLYSLVMTFMSAAGMGPAMIFFNERFPTPVRATGTSLSWNLGAALGGTPPTFVSLASGSVERLPMTLAVFLAAGSLLYLIGALAILETRGKFA
jgi:MFS family permease